RRGDARRDQAGVLHGLQVADRAGVDVHADRADLLLHEVVLARGQAPQRLRARRVVRSAVGEVDAARREEAAGAVEPGAAVDVRAVVVLDVEGLERDAVPLGAGAQVVVEHLLPRRGVDAGGVGEDAVEVEEARAGAVREAEHGRKVPTRRSPGATIRPMFTWSSRAWRQTVTCAVNGSTFGSPAPPVTVTTHPPSAGRAVTERTPPCARGSMSRCTASRTAASTRRGSTGTVVSARSTSISTRRRLPNRACSSAR